jgi:SulP family sulfate permease
MDLILPLLSPSLTVAMLGAIESLLSAVVADRMAGGGRHNPNVELVAQGIANIATPLVGGLPATGAIARTATNIRSGARTPVAGMVHAITILLVVLLFAPAAKHIPLPVLAAILMVVSYNMGEWREIPGILRLGLGDIAVWAITCFLTVFADLTVAVETGMVLAALTYIGRVTRTTSVAEVTSKYVEDGFAHSLQVNIIPEGVSVFRIHGPFLFGSTDKLHAVEERLQELGRVVILRLRNMTAIDGTGLHAIEHLALKLRDSGRELLLCGAREQPARFISNAKFHSIIGEENILPSLRAASARAESIVCSSAKE